MPKIIFDPVLQDYRTSDAPAGSGSSQTVTELTDGKIVLTADTVPFMIRTNLGTFYPIEKGSLSISAGGDWIIDPAPYLAYDDSQTFTGTWTVFFAG